MEDYIVKDNEIIIIDEQQVGNCQVEDLVMDFIKAQRKKKIEVKAENQTLAL